MEENIDIISKWISSCNTVDQCKNLNRFIYNGNFTMCEKALLMRRILS